MAHDILNNIKDFIFNIGGNQPSWPQGVLIDQEGGSNGPGGPNGPGSPNLIFFKPDGPKSPFTDYYGPMLIGKGKDVQINSVLYWDYNVNKWDSLTQP